MPRNHSFILLKIPFDAKETVFKLLVSLTLVGELEDEDESEGLLSSPPDSVSLASDRYDKEDEAPSDGM